MGTFSAKFLAAAARAPSCSGARLYERYYGIDYAAWSDRRRQRRRLRTRTSAGFAALCHARRPTSGGWVAANGMVIEQAQILTTHNLATLVGRRHRPGAGLARSGPALPFDTVCRLVTRVHGNPRPLGTIKDAAYAWRQMVFFLSLCGLDDQTAFPAYAEQRLATQPDHVRDPDSARRDRTRARDQRRKARPDGRAGTGRRFLGWSADRHWMLAQAG